MGDAAGRVVSRDGRDSVVRTGLPPRPLRDVYHTIVEISWPRLLSGLACLYVLLNLAFALLYRLQPDSITNARPGSFADAFFFSVQTMATIGYGVLTPATAFANVLVVLETIVSIVALPLVTGLMFAKFARPTAKVLFSDRAIVGVREGKRVFMFRLANARDAQLVDAKLAVSVVTDYVTKEGETMRRVVDLPLVRGQNPFFALSWTAVHVIDAGSPLHQATADSLAAAHVEIVVSLTGLDSTLSQTVYARHSYVAHEVVWGGRFVDVLSQLPDGRRRLDYARFHDIDVGGAPSSA